MKIVHSSNTRPWSCVAIALMGVLGGCTDDRMAGGNSSETPNTIAGRVVDSTGRSSVGDTVEIRPADWISDDIPAQGVDRAWRTTTDSLGRYRFQGVPSGSYVVRARNHSAGFLSAAVSVGRGRPEVDLGVDTVNPFQDVVGRVVADSSWIGDSAKVHVCGTDQSAVLDKSGAFRLEAVPAGQVRLLAILGRNASAARAKDEFRLPREGLIAPRLLAPTRFEDEDYSKWPRLRKARIVFSGRGWYLGSDQGLAPIRVRLDESILPGEWEATGASLRFGDSSGNNLPYEIESWDPVARRAEVWVRLDTANKGSEAHYLWLHWGRADAPARSDGSRVFDPAQGWVGVWHLSGGDPWKNSTGNGLRLVATSVQRANGAISGGLILSPFSRLLVEGDALQGWQETSISLWARIDSARDGANLARMGLLTDSDSSDWILGLSRRADSLRASFRTVSQIRSKASGLSASVAVGRWTSLGGVFSVTTPRLRLVVDDEAQNATWTDSFPARRRALVLGGGFSGGVDEIRLRRVASHPEAIRMQWGADRDDSPVLEWLP